jgi:hypothetical protein
LAGAGAVTGGFTPPVAPAAIGALTSSVGLFLIQEASDEVLGAGTPTLGAPSAGFFSNPNTLLRLDTDCAWGASILTSGCDPPVVEARDPPNAEPTGFLGKGSATGPFFSNIAFKLATEPPPPIIRYFHGKVTYLEIPLNVEYI